MRDINEIMAADRANTKRLRAELEARQMAEKWDDKEGAYTHDAPENPGRDENGLYPSDRPRATDAPGYAEFAQHIRDEQDAGLDTVRRIEEYAPTGDEPLSQRIDAPDEIAGTGRSFHFFETLLNAAEGHPSSKKFYDLLIEVGLLHAKKQKDYGKVGDPFANVRSTVEFGVPAWVGALIRMNDKVKRLQSLASHGELHNESAEDSMLDIAVYALIALVLYGEEGGAGEAPLARGAS